MDFLSTIIQQVNITGPNATIPVLPPITLANAFGDLTAALVMIALMLGITLRTYSEYISKLIGGEISHFDKKFFVTAIIAFFSSLPIAIGLMPEGSKVFLAYFGQWGVVGALIMVGIYGYGWNHLVNKLSKLIESRSQVSGAVKDKVSGSGSGTGTTSPSSTTTTTPPTTTTKP